MVKQRLQAIQEGLGSALESLENKGGATF